MHALLALKQTALEAFETEDGPAQWSAFLNLRAGLSIRLTEQK
jgi:hypothetical protein